MVDKLILAHLADKAKKPLSHYEHMLDTRDVEAVERRLCRFVDEEDDAFEYPLFTKMGRHEQALVLQLLDGYFSGHESKTPDPINNVDNLAEAMGQHFYGSMEFFGGYVVNVAMELLGFDYDDYGEGGYYLSKGSFRRFVSDGYRVVRQCEMLWCIENAEGDEEAVGVFGFEWPVWPFEDIDRED